MFWAEDKLKARYKEWKKDKKIIDVNFGTCEYKDLQNSYAYADIKYK